MRNPNVPTTMFQLSRAKHRGPVSDLIVVMSRDEKGARHQKTPSRKAAQAAQFLGFLARTDDEHRVTPGRK